jgi:hypothetical protein
MRKLYLRSMRAAEGTGGRVVNDRTAVDNRNMPSRITILASCFAMLCTCGMSVAAGPAKRARPPQFSKEVTDTFFPNALETLVGPRPQRKTAPDGSPSAEKPVSSPLRRAETVLWPAYIDAETLENEIKSQQRALGVAVASPLKFKGGQYEEARQALSVLAAMFTIVAEYEQPVRWQVEAAGIRDQMAKAAASCKVGSDASYQSAKARHDELESLIRGESLDAPSTIDVPSWPTIADRGTLMKRLEQALDAGLTPKIASSKTFASGTEELLHESQIVAALAEAIAREGYEYADDENFRELAGAMQSRSVAASKAIAGKDYESARQAIGEISKSCATCHERFRN